MNAMEHGNKYQADKPVRIAVTADATELVVRITDQGGGAPAAAAVMPDLDAKLAGEQSPRGWGLFLIEAMVDELTVEQTERGQAVVLTMYLEGVE
jgi:anti-sigma regulatory factor (Ser/Thr protein kinase)